MIWRRASDLGMKVKMAGIPFRQPASRPTSKPAAPSKTPKPCSVHESPRTTKLYDLTCDEITLDEVERIAI
jgi:hypothetical protein